MGNVLDNSLFLQKPDRFQELLGEVDQFNARYNGNNIIQDDIFSVLRNYARTKGVTLELLRFPAKDDDFCALTCVKQGKIIVYVNSWLPLANQIFAAAHELYHIWCFIEERDASVLRNGSYLTAAAMDEDVRNNEDREANAFAGMLLVPSTVLFEQMKIYGISREKQNLDDIIRLIGIFAVPYKAILLRLYEEKYMNIDKVREFLKIEKEVLEKAIGYAADADRWMKRTPEIMQMGNLKQLIDQNEEQELLTESRYKSDQQILNRILQQHSMDRV